MEEHVSRRAIGVLLVFLYVPFVIKVGVRYASLRYTDFPSFYAPLAREHHFVYVAPAAVMLLVAVLKRGRQASNILTLMAVIAALVIAWPVLAAHQRLPRFIAVLLASIKLSTVLVIWSLTMIELMRPVMTTWDLTYWRCGRLAFPGDFTRSLGFLWTS